MQLTEFQESPRGPTALTAEKDSGLGEAVDSLNFGFLASHDQQLTILGGLAERYFPSDPSTTIVKLRQFAELMAKLIAAHHATYRDAST